MNATVCEVQLKSWELVLQTGKKISLENIAKRLEKDPNERIHRTDDPPIVFDRKFYAAQRDIQSQLTQQFPEHTELINSVPAITGYEWKIVDYIDLYFRHFHLVIQKLRKKLCNK